MLRRGLAIVCVFSAILCVAIWVQWMRTSFSHPDTIEGVELPGGRSWDITIGDGQISAVVVQRRIDRKNCDRLEQVWRAENQKAMQQWEEVVSRDYNDYRDREKAIQNYMASSDSRASAQ